MKTPWQQHLVLAIALGLLSVGHYLGLSWAPRDAMMGEVQRIMYVHVPAAWMGLVSFTLTLIASIAYLAKKRPAADAFAAAATEVGVFFNGLALALGMLWGKPTWGAYWSWDPRLTFTLIMWLTYLGYLALRRFVDDGDKRPRWAAVYAIVAFANLPLVWFSVKWFRSLHQVQSTPKTVHPDMVLALRVNAFAFLFAMIWFIWRRYAALSQHAAVRELQPPERV